ncbi:dTDP-glucose 4,6-dehydratase [Bacillus mesophilus]|uniref:dTDP-glucose 4,6-dehydratase n=1 Tax=Bacillus mesophilus TaxID=1808955 RepID=A0A6M0Q7M2_9BACI|nr:dTDP-glucose 4,6-dehydratase [Bacillus mesophilus]MBM7661689.1 dTDP-glucose 4,6-dehydratase [Bacillus mesophilus]NEY72351.1 dTDP-glucose 4,6-dehydratase [Bacillus mesophilus]
MRKTILVTGGAGFIGSNFIIYMLEKYTNYQIINLDSLTYAGNLHNLKEVEENPNYYFIKGDICDRELIREILFKYNVTDVIHFAAESHVDNSISGPEVFIKTNVNGTFTLLNAVKNYWMDTQGEYKLEYASSRFHHISTDEVYGTLGETGLFTEETPYAPNSPYSASKASSDFLVRSYYHTYGLNVVTTNCSNNYGPKQHKEKLIPTIIRRARNLEYIPVYGDGKNVRDWLYVRDHCIGIDLAFHKGTAGETYNIGGRNEKENIYIVNKICSILDEMIPEKLVNSSYSSFKDLIRFVNDRPGHDRRYAIDATKIEKQIGWTAEENFETGIYKTVEWYLRNEK